MHSFNGTVHFSDIKISSHPIPKLFLVYFKTGFWIHACMELKNTNGGKINSAVGIPYILLWYIQIHGSQSSVLKGNSKLEILLVKICLLKFLCKKITLSPHAPYDYKLR